jgi:hypothetical protein
MDSGGMMAINNALILEGAIFQTTYKRFQKELVCFDFIDFLHEVRTFTSLETESPQPAAIDFVPNRTGQLVGQIPAQFKVEGHWITMLDRSPSTFSTSWSPLHCCFVASPRRRMTRIRMLKTRV